MPKFLTLEKMIGSAKDKLANPDYYKNEHVRSVAKVNLHRLIAGLCRRCGKAPFVFPITNCQSCRELQNKTSKKRSRNRAKNGTCLRCPSPAADSRYCKLCIVKKREGSKVFNKNTRKLIFDHYGWVCVCCGEKEPMFLTLDHVNNDGHMHRRRDYNKNSGTPNMLTYRKVIKEGFPPTYQTLCYNCNCGKSRNNGICPHKGRVEVKTMTSGLN